MPTGKVSWFGGPQDSSDSGHTALGITTATPGIALYNRSTLGGYWRVKFPNGRTLTLRQTDIGPAPWTGRKVDVTYSALRQAGYTTGNFPTDANVQYSYLGKNPPKGGASQQSSGGQAGTPGTTRITKTVTPGVDNSALRNQLKFQYLSQAPASPFSQKNLTPGKLPDLSKAAAVPPLSAQSTAPDPMKYLGQANAKTNALLSLAGNLQGAQDVAPTSKTVTQRAPGTPAPGGGGGGSGGRKWSQPVPGVAMGRTDNGVDFEAPVGTKLRALGAGTIVNNDGGFPGSLVLKLDRPLPNGQRFIYYGHLQRGDMLARVGQRVSAGQVVARTSRSPVDAAGMPGHTEIGIARDAGGAPQIGRHVETGESSWGRYFAHVLRNLRG